jgi:hypothetical protein
MRRFVDWVGGAVWGVALYRLWKRWRSDDAEPWPEPAPAEADADDRAEELRAKLAETRVSEEEPPPPEPARPESPEERRRRVHEEGRAAIDEMHGE